MLPPAVLDKPTSAIARVGRTMLARGMTDVAGGNISVRDGDDIYMTPRYAGHHWHWDIAPGDVLRFDLAGKRIDGYNEPSRDLHVHLAAYAAAPEAGAVVHAHAPHALAFAAAGRAIPPVTLAAEMLGRIEVAAVHGDDPIDEVEAVRAFAALARARIAAFAAAILIPRHGIVVIGRDLAHAYDGLERAEACARAVLLGRLLDRHDDGAPTVATDRASSIGTIDLLSAAPSPVNGSASAAV
ncbi:MAG: class II aldolase/adducin family protein [Ardenticatenales bacterium]|nr:class II aldolase/adducin family protein [Ardenticatenales bacterium]